jgi:hypothetical protein
MVVLLFLLTICSPADSCPSIEHYISLSIQFDRDTITMGDSLTLNIEYCNKTTKDIEFYPECVQFLAQPIVAFGVDKSLCVNNVSNLTKLVCLTPDGRYTQKVVIISNNTFLHLGMNNLYMFYRCPELKDKVNKKYNRLCGNLKSNVVNLYVNIPDFDIAIPARADLQSARH